MVDRDEKLTGELLCFLKENHVNVDLPGCEKLENNMKKDVLEYVQQSLEQWSHKLLLEKGAPEDVVNQKHIAVLPSGSYAMGFVEADSDLDAVCVVSQMISREDFFTSFKRFSEELKDIELVRSLDMTRCPVMEMTIKTIELDLTLAILNFQCLPMDLKITGDDGDSEDSRLMEKMDERCIRSLNGYRNVSVILSLLPDVGAFKILLKTVKFWAKRRGIYSNSVGYLGGMACAELVTYICTNFSESGLLAMLERFFEVFSQWRWPKAVLLRELTDSGLGYDSWDPRVDYSHLMPIITPCYPHSNCAYNVEASGRKTIVEEFKRAYNIIRRSQSGTADVGTLFDELDFFGTFRIFLVIIIKTKEGLDSHLSWQGLVESRIRFLVRAMDENESIESSRIYQRHIMLKGKSTNYLTKWFIGLILKKSKDGCRSIDLSVGIERFKSLVLNRASEYGWRIINIRLDVVSNTKSKTDPRGEMVKCFLPDGCEEFLLFEDLQQRHCED